MIRIQNSNPIKLRHDDFDVLVSYQGDLKGSLTHKPIREEVPVDRENRIVYGFTSPEDEIMWTVWAPETSEYLVAVHYTGKMYLSDRAQRIRSWGEIDKFGLAGKTFDPECIVEVTVNGRTLQAELQRLTQYNEPDRVAGSRQWLGLLPLESGENPVSLHFSKLSNHQVRVARRELAEGTLRKSTVSLGIKSIELVRPKTWEGIKERAKQLRSNTDWMVEGKYGLFIHWSLRTYPLYGEKRAIENFEWGVNVFDVEAFADMVEETGASWVMFTTCHGAHFFPAPIEALDEVLPSRTTERDLVGELADALKSRGIHLLLYYNTCANDKIFRKVGMEDNPQRWFDFLVDFTSEVSYRYGKKISGWGYIDSTVPLYEYNMPMEPYVQAMKAGNSDGVVGISNHWWAEMTPFNELQTADSGGNLFEPLNPAVYDEAGRYEGLQPHFSFTMDGSWVPREPFMGVIRKNSKAKPGPVYPFEKYISYFEKMDQADVPLTVNMLITQDVTRNQPFINPQCLQLMRRIRRAVWGN